MVEREISIAGRPIGPGHPPYVVAEMSANHGGDLDRALAIVEGAATAGADAVKLQTYRPESMTLESEAPRFTVGSGPWQGEQLYALYRRARTPWRWHETLFARGRELGITVFSAPFDEAAVELLEDLEAPAYKIASFEAVDLPLIRRVAETGKPVIISTGMANLQEIAEAVAVVRDHGSGELALLHCLSTYPAPAEEANLCTIPDMAEKFQCVCGFSDHTLGPVSAIAAVALGADLVEKHVTDDRARASPDSSFSMEPEELAGLVRDLRTAWKARGDIVYGPRPSEEVAVAYRRSLYAVSDIEEGEALSRNNVRSIRPSGGLPPKHLPEILGRHARCAIAKGTPLDWSMIQ